MSPTIFCIGETVLDIIFKQRQPVSATPGGSMLNSAVSLGRAGLKVELISEFGNDEEGVIIDTFLRDNNVGTTFVQRFDDGKTALALAFLDKKQNASYSFHTAYPQKRMKKPLPGVKSGDVILFGSIYSITPGIHQKILPWVKKSGKAGALVVYDPNFRKSHLGMLEMVRPWIEKNIASADIVRGSDDDFGTVFSLYKPGDVRKKMQGLSCRNLIITRNSKSVIAWFGDHKTEVGIPPVKPLVSTVGAGDNFNAGIIFALVSSGLNRNGARDVSPEDAGKILSTGISFSADVCKSLDNYISHGFSKRLKK